MKLKITNTETGCVFEGENTNHRWNDLCLEIAKANTDYRLVYCDTECLLKDTEDPDGTAWYFLDECGNWAYLPNNYTVEITDPTNPLDILEAFELWANHVANLDNETFSRKATILMMDLRNYPQHVIEQGRKDGWWPRINVSN